MIRVFSFLLLLATSPDPASSGASDTSVPAHLVLPVCGSPSHDQLIERRGRDVCGPALDDEGRPRSIGLMPTRCPQKEDTLKTDASGTTDYCISHETNRPSQGDKS